MDIDRFVSEFHNLRGISIGEKRKNFFILLKNVPADHAELVATIQPKNHRETVFKLEILLRLERISELIEVLKSGEEFLCVKVLKNKRFCQNFARLLDQNSIDLVRDVLPFTSFVIRMRLIERLAEYGVQLDQVYDDVCARYGAHIGAHILVGCSAQKVEHVLSTEPHTVLVPRHIVLLHRKHPQLLVLYLSNQSCCPFVGHTIACQDQEAFVDIRERFGVNATLGKCLTRNLCKLYKDFIIRNAAKLYKDLHLKSVVKVLSVDDFKQFFFNILPDSPRSIYWIGERRFQKLLGNRYYKLLSEALEIKMKCKIDNYPELISDEMFQCMDDGDREKWIEIHKKTRDFNDLNLIKLLKPVDAFPIIKNKINLTSDVCMRTKLIETLVINCKMNNDLNALAELLSYVSVRHRNDDAVLKGFISKLQQQFQLEKLEERHWKSFNTIINVLNMKGDGYCDSKMIPKMVEFLWKNNKLEDRHVCEYLRKDCDFGDDWGDDLKRFLILKAVELAPSVLNDGDSIELYDLKVISAIVRWNKDYPKYCISVYEFPRLVESLKKAVELAKSSPLYNRDLCDLPSILKAMICCEDRSMYRDEMIVDYLILREQYYEVEIELWLLKHQPDIISQHFEQFLEHMFMVSCNEWNVFYVFHMLKNYDDYSFPQKTIDYCLSKLDSEQLIGTWRLFSALAILMPSERFVSVCTQFRPTSNKIDESKDNSRDEFQLQMRIIQGFKYGNVEVLPSLLDYCKGDFLGRCLESLYYLFYHSPENRLFPFIEQLSTKAVSVRKHSIFLTCKLLPTQEVWKIIKHFNDNDNNVSIRKHLLMSVWKYFQLIPSDQIWAELESSISKVDKSDDESLNRLVEVYKIPRKYQVRYVMKLWEILERHQTEYRNFRESLLSKIPNSLFSSFPLEFLLGIISKYFLQQESRGHEELIASLAQTSYSEQVLDVVFNIVADFKRANYTDIEKEKIARTTIYNSVERIVQRLQGETLRKFSERWHALFTPTESIKEHLMISIALLYSEANEVFEKFAETVAEFLERLVTVYGILIVDVFADEFSKSLPTFLYCRNQNEDYFRCLRAWKNMDREVLNVLVLKLLPLREPSDVNAKTLFWELFQDLRQVPQESVQMLTNIRIMDF